MKILAVGSGKTITEDLINRGDLKTAERKCLMTFYPTKCKDNCFNCKCGGEEATKDMYVSIHNVQRVCALTGGAADTDEGEYIAEVIQNNLENMVIEAQPVKCGKWIRTDESWGVETVYACSECGYLVRESERTNYCGDCGVRMRGEQHGS